MTTEHSTYTYESGEQETVTLKHGTADPHGHALLLISYSDGRRADCYVNTAWLRDRLNDLGEPRRTEPHPLTPDAIEERVERAEEAYHRARRENRPDALRMAVLAALTEPPARPEGAEDIEVLLFDVGVDENRAEVANYLAARLTDPTRKEA